MSGKLPCTVFCGCHAENCHKKLTKCDVVSEPDNDDDTKYTNRPFGKAY